MSSYVNVKAIKLITLFVGFTEVYKTPGSSLAFKYSCWALQAWVGLRTGLEEHNLMFGANGLAEKLGQFEIQS